MHGSGLLRPGWTHVQHLKHTDSNPCSTIVFKQNWEIIRYVKYTRKPPTDVLYHSSYKMTLNQEHHVVLRSLLKLRHGEGLGILCLYFIVVMWTATCGRALCSTIVQIKASILLADHYLNWNWTGRILLCKAAQARPAIAPRQDWWSLEKV